MSAKGRYEPRNVLVVEDDQDDVELLLIAARTVPDAACFHMVRSGEEALAYLEGNAQFADRKAHPFPDLVLLDLALPGMNGFEVLAWIRRHPQFSALKVFIWTDSGNPNALDRALKVGANRFVPKSVAFVRGGLAGLVRGIAAAIPDSAEPEVP